MKVEPKTIQIFLPDGNPRSLKIAEITSRTVQAALIPRSKIDEAAKRKELSSVGIYFLFGENDDGSKPQIYIGESEDCFSRLKQHNREKDFWQASIIITSKTQYFTKSHVKYLEAYSAEIAAKANRFSIENNTVPAKPHISESTAADLKDNFNSIKLLVSTFGYAVFDEAPDSSSKTILICKGKKALARGEYAEGGVVVLAGSTANIEEVASADNWVLRVRERLLHNGVLKRKGDVYSFTSNYAFKSPSAAAVAVLGMHSNGWKTWKYADGRTLDEVQRQNI